MKKHRSDSRRQYASGRPISLNIPFWLLIPFWFLIGCLAAGSLPCRAQSAPSPSSPIVRAWLDALDRHDTLALAALYADSAKIFSPNWEGAETGPPGIRKVYRRYFTSTPDLQHRIIHLIVTDSALVIEYFQRGTLQNPEGGTPAYMQGKKYELQCCTRMDIRNGKIQRQVSYFDQVAFLRQMGFFEQMGK
jgi:steroid delta-isomerase-like uncharacterized protein